RTRELLLDIDVRDVQVPAQANMSYELHIRAVLAARLQQITGRVARPRRIDGWCVGALHVGVFGRLCRLLRDASSCKGGTQQCGQEHFTLQEFHWASPARERKNEREKKRRLTTGLTA